MTDALDGGVASGRLHHFGFVVGSIAKSAESAARSVRGQWDGRTFDDCAQGARVTFIQPGLGYGPLLELVEPLYAGAPTSRFLASGGGLHHVCYEVPDLEQELAGVDPQVALIVKGPAAAVAFCGRPIAWVRSREGLLIEFLQAELPSASILE